MFFNIPFFLFFFLFFFSGLHEFLIKIIFIKKMNGNINDNII
jgi:hypothetical protein